MQVELKDRALRDHDRPLTCRETLAGIEPALGTGAVRVAPEFYRAGASDLLGQLRALPAAVGFRAADRS
jgi:hypothetical protein